MLETNIEIMRFQLSMAKSKKDKDGINEIIDKSHNAIEIVKGIDHYEILVSLYNSFVCRRENFFVCICGTIAKEGLIEKWDKTEDGFKEFLELEKQAIEQTDKEEKEKMETAKIIKEAKAQGKKVELIYDKGKIRPVVVNETLN
jgi:hypothetical protein